MANEKSGKKVLHYLFPFLTTYSGETKDHFLNERKKWDALCVGASWNKRNKV